MAQSQLYNSWLHGRELNSLYHNGRDKIVSCLAQSQLSNSWLHGRELNSLYHNGRDKIVSCLAHSQLQTDCSSKSLNSLAHCFQAWYHSHSSLISYLGFIMAIVIIISFAREHKLYPMSVHLN